MALSKYFCETNLTEAQQGDDEAKKRRMLQIERLFKTTSELDSFQPKDWEEYTKPCVDEFKVDSGLYKLNHPDVQYMPTGHRLVFYNKIKSLLKLYSENYTKKFIVRKGADQINKVLKSRASSLTKYYDWFPKFDHGPRG